MSLGPDRQQNAPSDETTPGVRFVVVLKTLGRHPNSAVLRLLERGPLRFNEMSAELSDLREATLNSALRELGDDGFVRRLVDAGPPLRVLYQLTPLGVELAPSLRAIGAWAERKLAAR